MIQRLEATFLPGYKAQLGESPLWDEQRNRLYFTDIEACTVCIFDPGSAGYRTRRFSSRTGSLGLTQNGKLLVALQNEIVIWNSDTDEVLPFISVPDMDPNARFNDGKIGPDGAFWVGTMDMRPERAAIGKLYRIDPHGQVSIASEGIRISNGLAWSPDGTRMYHADTRGTWIDTFDFDRNTGALANRNRFATPDLATGLPDGAAVDCEGYYWSCGVTAGVINKFNPAGELIERYAVPVDAPTMLAFGGPQWRTLYITSLNREAGKPGAAASTAGCLLQANAPVAGLPSWRMPGH